MATRVKGHEDLVEPDKTGLLFPYGDAAAFADAVQRLSDPSRRLAMGQAAHQAVQTYAIRPVFEELTTLYRQAAGLADGTT